MFKLSLQTRLPAAQRHGAGVGSRWVSRGCLGLGRARSSWPWFHTARVSRELVAPRVAPFEGTWDCSTWLKGFRHTRWHLPARGHCTQTELPALVCCRLPLGAGPELPLPLQLSPWPPRALCAFLAALCPRQSFPPLHASRGCRVCSSRSSPSSHHPSAGGGRWCSARFCHPTAQHGDPCDAPQADPSQPAAVATHAPTSPWGGTREALCLAPFSFLVKRHPDPYSQLSEQPRCLHFPFVSPPRPTRNTLASLSGVTVGLAAGCSLRAPPARLGSPKPIPRGTPSPADKGTSRGGRAGEAAPAPTAASPHAEHRQEAAASSGQTAAPAGEGGGGTGRRERGPRGRAGQGEVLQGAEEGAEPWPGAAAWGRSGGKLGDRSAAVIRQGEGGRGWKL